MEFQLDVLLQRLDERNRVESPTKRISTGFESVGAVAQRILTEEQLSERYGKIYRLDVLREALKSLDYIQPTAVAGVMDYLRKRSIPGNKLESESYVIQNVLPMALNAHRLTRRLDEVVKSYNVLVA